MELSLTEPWQILAAAGMGLSLLEFFMPGFVALPAGVAFLLTAGVAAVYPSWPAVLVALTVNMLGVYWLAQRHVWPRFRPPQTRTGADGMIGQLAVVTEAIEPESGTGYVKLYGDSWRAVSEQAFAVGAKVTIIATVGNKVVVCAVEHGAHQANS